MASFFIDGGALVEISSQMEANHVAYGFGSKARSLDAAPSEIKRIDCSGYVRYLIYQATGGQVRMPDGSVVQHQWCIDQKLSKVPYSESGQSDGWLRIAFYAPGKGHAGHVWLILNGRTLESFGGHGPGRKSWRDRTKIAQACYKLGQTYTIEIGPIEFSTGGGGFELGAAL